MRKIVDEFSELGMSGDNVEARGTEDSANSNRESQILEIFEEKIFTTDKNYSIHLEKKNQT